MSATQPATMRTRPEIAAKAGADQAGRFKMRLLVQLALLCAIGLAGCDQQLSGPPKVLKLGSTYNMWSHCIGHAEHRCGPEDEEIPDLFTTAFAAEPECRGVQLRQLTHEEKHIPVKEIDGYLMMSFLSPGDWLYQVNVKGKLLSANVTNEREIARDVCRIITGNGGQI